MINFQKYQIPFENKKKKIKSSTWLNEILRIATILRIILDNFLFKFQIRARTKGVQGEKKYGGLGRELGA